ncbi:hypothetical protein IDH44_10820 [Paenibacillus sp. IB182496]|uniref:Uncharacterized protein n=1 Tax=Paenibacillus sabuli TaxID=2772509 RepID=A0A927BRZ2_9BACL|nr:hypothetical protein [Paenibacillus sabuli]MBD2845682.1 hypothetical protein [Paenibacillus sabuli]
MDYNWETWSQFFQENWLVLLVALVVLFIVVNVVKTVIKWVIVAVIVIAIVVYSGYNLEDLKTKFDDLKEMSTQVADSVRQEAMQAMAGEMTDATYTSGEDGSYTVRTDNLQLSGRIGDNEVAVIYRGAPLGKWKIDATIQSLIEHSRQNG